MKRNTLLIVLPVVALIAGLLIGRTFFAGSADAHAGHDHAADGSAQTSSSTDKAQIWTCSMHPQIRQPVPGKCPICAMDLIPVAAKSESDDSPRALTMSASALALADIQTVPVERRFPEATLRLVGQLDYDETRLRSLTARFPARIDELYVNYTGVSVARGEHLARIYSPELLTAQRELLSANALDPDGTLVRVVRDKLRLWDLLPEQIDAILARGTVADSFDLRAPTGGVVVLKNIKEGDYVETGEALFRIADLSELWLHLQAFESDLAKLRYGQDVTFTVSAWPGETFIGRIAFVAPQVDPQTRTVPIRVNVPNVDGRLKPGMFARGQVHVKLSGNNEVFAPELAGKWISPMHPEIVKNGPGSCDICGMALVPAESLGYSQVTPDHAPLVVPASAVLATGKRAVVYVKKTGTEANTFEGREVVLGSEADDSVIIVSGLAEGELVVTQGAFKIDSSLQILAKPSMMNPAGGGPASGHNHGTSPVAAKSAASAIPAADALVLDSARAAALLPAYLQLQIALAADDLPGAKQGINALLTVTGHDGPLHDQLHSLLDTKKLDAIRTPFFEHLSTAMITALKADHSMLKAPVIHMHCPMAGDDGADWLQATDALRNPYYGADMLTCGDIVERIQ